MEPQRSAPVLKIFFYILLFFLSVIINNSSLFLDAKTTTNRTTAQIMYSVKSSLSGGGRRGSENVHWSETREHPDRERLNVTPRRGGKEGKQTPEGKKRKDGKTQFGSHKSPIRGIKVLKRRITMNHFSG